MTSNVEKMLKRWTGQGRRYWVHWVGTQIGKCIKRGTTNEMDPKKHWLADLAKEIRPLVDSRIDPKADENIALAKVVSLILALWAARVCRGKCNDPRRPVSQRRKGYKATLNWQLALVECLMDESLDQEYFSDQQWEPPFVPVDKVGRKL